MEHDGAAERSVRDCGHFIGLNGNFHFTSEFCWAQSAKRQLNSFIPIPNHVCFNLLHKVLQCNTLPRATVEHLVLHPPEESLTGWIVWRASFSRHGSGKTCIVDPLNPTRLPVMAASIWMKNRMYVLRKRVDCTIKHGIYQLRIWFAANIPGYRHTIIAIDNRREIYFSCWYWELSHIGQPFLVWLVSLEIPLDYIWHFRTDFPFVRAVFSWTSAFHKQSIFTHDSADHLFREDITFSI